MLEEEEGLVPVLCFEWENTLKKILFCNESPEGLREFATPRESSGPNRQDAWASPCSSVRFTTLDKIFVDSFLEGSGE